MELCEIMPTRILAWSVAALMATAPAFAYTGEKLAAKAKITISEAEQIALKARPGKVTDRELEREKGGSGLRYSFDVNAAGKTYEVGVDAMSGAVLENGMDGAHPD
jgi:uncharacterized membrane protein YkoI